MTQAYPASAYLTSTSRLASRPGLPSLLDPMSAADQSGCGLKSESSLLGYSITQLHIRAQRHISPCLTSQVAIPARPYERCRPKRLRPQKFVNMRYDHPISTTDPMMKAMHLQNDYSMKQELRRRTQRKSTAAPTAAFSHHPIDLPGDAATKTSATKPTHVRFPPSQLGVTARAPCVISGSTSARRHRSSALPPTVHTYSQPH